MAAFFTDQLDFIFFFYGLAFILLGSVCFAIVRGGRQGTPWLVLGAFGFLHGANEWFDLLALVVGDSIPYTVFRIALMAFSFAVLLEFPRLEAVRLGITVPGRWIYAPLLLAVVAGGYFAGPEGANVLARYLLGFPGAAAASAILVLHAKAARPARRRWIISAVVGFALYAVAAGLIVPAAPFWPANVVNYAGFIHLTGVPIQLIRGMLACWIAFAVWGVWGQWLVEDVASPRYATFMQRQFVKTLAAMAAILVVGWVLTEYLGDIYRKNVQDAAVGDLDLIASLLSRETATVDGVTKALAGSRAVRDLVAGGARRDGIESELNLAVEAASADDGYILDRAGKQLARSRLGNSALAPNADYSTARYFKTAMAGQAGYELVFDPQARRRDYIASYPVRDSRGTAVGVAVLQKSLDAFELDLRRFDRTFFLVDPRGVVVATNRPDTLFKPLWPANDGRGQQTAAKPLLASEFATSAWVTIDRSRSYVQRRPVNHSGWSLVTATVPRGIFASRVLGIIITLQMATVALVYLVGRERWVHDNVQSEKRLQLEELTRTLDLRATTDPLTGLFNRRRFNRELAKEILRAARYKSPLSLVLFDIDRFKSINDTYGHQAGDKLLIELSRFVSAQIRANDVLTRWGGDEFMILTPGCSVEMAAQMAENLRSALQGIVIDGVGTISCSFGVAQFEEGDTPDTLMARADEAMYEAKVQGRNRVAAAAGR